PNSASPRNDAMGQNLIGRVVLVMARGGRFGATGSSPAAESRCLKRLTGRSINRLSPQVGYARTTQAVCEVLPMLHVKVGGRNVEVLLRVRRPGDEIMH